MNLETMEASPQAPRTKGAVAHDARALGIDQHVGRRVRLRRKETGVSQQQLAEHLGVSFQQVQKYEKGANRVSASIMWMAAERLGCSPLYFFHGLAVNETAAAGDDAELSEVLQDAALRPVVLGLSRLGKRAFQTIAEAVDLLQGAL